jgi:dTMP kinase
MFITFEGIDGSGKSTQLALVARRLRDAGRAVVETVEPGGTVIGRKIRQILLDPEHSALSPVAELLLYFAARAQNVDDVIQPALRRGAVVLSDRFTDSTLVYQGHGRGLGADTVLALDRVACRGLAPNLTLFLDIAVDTALDRARQRGADRMEAEDHVFYQRVRDAYHALSAAEPARVIPIDATGSPDAVAARVWTVVSARLK